MCLILVVWRVHPLYPCVIAANRDEFHARPAQPARWWSDRPHILGGRDLSGGGTWLGMTRDGRFAGLTNFRGDGRFRPEAPSRGALVAAMLDSTASVPGALEELERIGERYNGFNLIFSDGRRLGVYESAHGRGRELQPGIYGLSNDVLDSPWPKVRRAKSRLQAALGDLSDSAPMLELLRDDHPAPDEELPRSGLGREWDRLLSSAFVRSAEYGTRCSTLVRVGVDRRVHFDEWTWDAAGRETGRTGLAFSLAEAR